MQQLLDDLEQAARAMPFEMEVTADALDTDRLPCVIAERLAADPEASNPLQLAGQADATVFLAFASDILWSDIEAVTGAFVDAYKSQAPATAIRRVQMGRGASDIRLVELRVETGYAINLDTLPDDFRFSY
jgi:hypothetical protein